MMRVCRSVSIFLAVLCVSLVTILAKAGEAMAAQSLPSGERADLVGEAAKLLDMYRGDTRQLQQAAELLTLAQSSDAENPALYVELSRLEMKRFGLDSATLQRCEQWLRKAIELDPRFGNAEVLLGYVLTHQYDFAEAEKALDRAEELSASSPWLHMNRGELYKMQERMLEAMIEYSQVVETPSIPADIRGLAQEMLAGLFAAEHDPKAAMAAYSRALSLQPNDAWVMGHYSRFLRVSMLNTAESEKWARKALDRMKFGYAEESLGATLVLKWAERRAAGAGAAELDTILKEAKRYLPDPAEVLREVEKYPRVHPVIAALAAIRVSLDRFPGGYSGGGTPLVSAVGKRNRAIAEALLDAGASVDAQGYQGVTPLIVAAYQGDDEMVKFLLLRGADPHLMTSDGEDAEAAAKQQDHLTAAALLADAKRAVPVAGQVLDTAPVIGARYRIVRDVPGNGWTSADRLKKGIEFVYRGPCSIMGRTQELVTDHHCYFYRKDGEAGDDTWAIKKDDLHQWSYYVERVSALRK